MTEGFRYQMTQIIAEQLHKLYSGQPLPVTAHNLITRLERFKQPNHVNMMIDGALAHGGGRSLAIVYMDKTGFPREEGERLVDARIEELSEEAD